MVCRQHKIFCKPGGGGGVGFKLVLVAICCDDCLDSIELESRRTTASVIERHTLRNEERQLII